MKTSGFNFNTFLIIKFLKFISFGSFFNGSQIPITDKVSISPIDFKPSAGKIEMYHPPAGNGIRLDTFIYSGYKVPHYYDNLLAKLIVTGRTRNHAIKRALRSLNEIVIDGIEKDKSLFL